jgi:hypothetical protein
MKDVTEIQDSSSGFTLVTPARNLVIETASQGELETWLRALVESCPQANVDKVRSVSASQPKPAIGAGGGQWSKEEEVDLDEYRPLDRDGLMQLHQLSQSGKGDSSGKSLDRSISLFSRHADGDKNSFYFASSGQTQKLAALSGPQQSSDEEGDGRNRHFVGEGELMAELGGMQRDQPGKRGSRGGVASDRERDNSRGSRDNRDSREADHRLNSGRATGGYGGGESSTSNRLHRHITRDSPARGSSATDTVNPNVHRNRGADAGDGEEDAEVAGAAGPHLSDKAFNSTNSLRVNTSTPPSPQSTRMPAERSPNGGIEVVDAGRRSEGQERAARSKAMLRDRQRRQQLRRSRSGSGSDSASDDGAGSKLNSDSSASDSDGDYARANRTAVSSKNRRRLGSGEDPDGRGGGSGTGTPTQRFAGKTLSGGTNSGSSGNLKPVPAPLAAPPRRARDALLQEAAADGSGAGSPARAPVRESLDEVLRRRPSVDVADAKAGAPSSLTNEGSDDEDTQIDFKVSIHVNWYFSGPSLQYVPLPSSTQAEMRRYGAGRGEDAAGLSSSAPAEAKETGKGKASITCGKDDGNNPPSR